MATEDLADFSKRPLISIYYHKIQIFPMWSYFIFDHCKCKIPSRVVVSASIYLPCLVVYSKIFAKYIFTTTKNYYYIVCIP